MTSPSKQILEAFEAGRTGSQLFAGKTDAQLEDRLLMDHIGQEGGEVFLLPHESLRRDGVVDPLDGDIQDTHFRSLDDLALHENAKYRVLIQHTPSRQVLKKYGIDEERSVVFWFTSVMLRDRGRITSRRFRGIDIGDLIVWDRTWYRVDNVHRDHYFGQSDQYFFVGAFCNRYRHTSRVEEGA